MRYCCSLEQHECDRVSKHMKAGDVGERKEDYSRYG